MVVWMDEEEGKQPAAPTAEQPTTPAPATEQPAAPMSVGPDTDLRASVVATGFENGGAKADEFIAALRGQVALNVAYEKPPQ